MDTYQNMEAEQLLKGGSAPPIEATSSRRRPTVVTAVVALTAVAGAVAAVVTYGSSGRNAPAVDMAALGHKQADETFGDDMYSTQGPYVDEEYDCSDYDDDTYFTADVCSGYDYATCYGDKSIVSNCVDSFWCNKLCGDMCSEGAGAICFFQKISDLQTTCSTVANLRATQNQTTNPWAPDGLSAVAERKEEAEEEKEKEKKEKTSCGKGCLAATTMAAEELRIPGPAKEVTATEARQFMDEFYPNARSGTMSEAVATGHGLSDDIEDEGCGRHSYCSECTSFCKEKLMKKYLSNKFGVDTGAGAGGYSPSSLKQALENIVETCAYFGMYV